MPVISTSIAIGSAITSAIGLGTVSTLTAGAVGAAALSTGTYGLTQGVKYAKDALKPDAPAQALTGAISPEDPNAKEKAAIEAARKQAFRSGTVFTSPSGLYGDDTGNTTSARLK